MFPKIVVPQNGWFIMENPIKMDDLEGPPLFLETPIYIYICAYIYMHIYIYALKLQEHEAELDEEIARLDALKVGVSFWIFGLGEKFLSVCFLFHVEEMEHINILYLVFLCYNHINQILYYIYVIGYTHQYVGYPFSIFRCKC